MYVTLSLNDKGFQRDAKRLQQGLLILLELGIIDLNEAKDLIGRMANHVGKYIKQT